MGRRLITFFNDSLEFLCLCIFPFLAFIFWFLYDLIDPPVRIYVVDENGWLFSWLISFHPHHYLQISRKQPEHLWLMYSDDQVLRSPSCPKKKKHLRVESLLFLAYLPLPCLPPLWCALGLLDGNASHGSQGLKFHPKD